MARIMRQRRTEALFGILMFDLSMLYVMDEGENFVMDEGEFFSIEATRVGCGRISIRMTRVVPPFVPPDVGSCPDWLFGFDCKNKPRPRNEQFLGCDFLEIHARALARSSTSSMIKVRSSRTYISLDDDRVVLSMMVRPTDWFGQRKPCSSATLNDVARAHKDRIFIVTSGTLFAQGVMKAREEFVSAAAGGADFDDRILQYIMTKNRTIRQKDIISKMSSDWATHCLLSLLREKSLAAV